MVAQTSNRTPIAVIAGVCALLLVAVYTGFRLSQDPDEVTVDLSAEWTPRRNLTVHWQIGALISAERFTANDRDTWNLTINVPRGTEVVILAEQDDPGYLVCSISTDGLEQARTVIPDGAQDCRVEWTA